MESILASVKQQLGITPDNEDFDNQIIMHINSVFMILTQLGVGPSEGFIIEDDSSTWDEFIANPMELQGVKSYIFMKVKLLFDPPDRSGVLSAYNDLIKEFEWRLNADADYKTTT
jgi:hypothetical protein